MIASAFDEENAVLDAPGSMTPDECEPLPVWRGVLENGNLVVISCWKVTAEELEEIRRTGRVYLMVMGASMPPVQLWGISPWKET